MSRPTPRRALPSGPPPSQTEEDDYMQYFDWDRYDAEAAEQALAREEQEQEQEAPRQQVHQGHPSPSLR